MDRLVPSRIPVAAALALAVLLQACGTSTQEQQTPQKVLVATAAAGALSVDLLADDRLETGLTPIHLRVRTAAGDLVTDADVTFEPMMAMSGGKSHGAPIVDAPALGADGLYHGAVVFQMPSGTMGSWSATVDVTRPGAATVQASFPSLAIADAGAARTFTWFDPGLATTTKYVSSLNFQSAPRVGLNSVIATLHRMQDMTTFVPVDDATIALDPQMPSMGHGSPGSVDPTLVSSGVYAGKLSFSMAGDWETTVTFKRGGVTIGAPKFSTTF